MKKILSGLLFLIITSSCGKSAQNIIPYVYVYFNSTLANPALLNLKAFGGAVVITGYGYAGLILYNNGEEIVAYDRCSTVNPEKKCALNLDNPTISVTDPCSGGKFSLLDGSASKAPAQYPLRRYQVSINGNNISVYN
jgi:nitrite reductase/ring-hydroxylating ferredoxin subunit